MKTDSTDELSLRLLLQLEDIAASYGIEIPIERKKVDLAFEYLVRCLFENTGKKVVILIDEYDKGIIEVLQDEKLMEEAIKTLRPFFSVLKSHDRYIRFAFITGVSRFRNTTIFSGFNNPYDISMDPEFAALCGITRHELEENFSEGIRRISDRYGYSYDKTVEELLQKYDGYRFSLERVYVCNPFSILNVMRSAVLDNYWIMSGSSKILIEYMRQSHMDIEGMTSQWVGS